MKGKRNAKTKISVITHITEPNAAGIDVGATEMYVAVPPGPRRAIGAMLCKLHLRATAIGRLG
jgi:hypothetical protein